VYSMAEETFLPAMAKVAEKFRAARELEKLENYFGGEARFDEIARQISAWANKNIDAATFETLSTTYTGVISLYNMMKNGEPALLGSRVANDDHVSEEKLRKMMRDPKYWRDNDEAFIKKIDEGFKNLYAKK
ncbi:MAG: hypothetical protein FWD15_04375, partial [Alphaproteobacteria bacterium]|nr:hypothetical protein [Alphaproteobacteria bacterium]